jgi:nicotinamide-nucleotide adenylyltransferase
VTSVLPVRGLLVGRFQPFHRGHLSVIRWARARRPNEMLLLGIGSAQESHTWTNPFTAGERWEMISAALEEAKVDRWAAFPIPDIQRHSQWVAYVASLLPRFEHVYTHNPLTKVLFEEAGYAVETPPLERRRLWQGDTIRRRISSGAVWKSLVPPAVGRWIERARGPERIRLIAPEKRREHRG